MLRCNKLKIRTFRLKTHEWNIPKENAKLQQDTTPTQDQMDSKPNGDQNPGKEKKKRYFEMSQVRNQKLLD